MEMCGQRHLFTCVAACVAALVFSTSTAAQPANPAAAVTAGRLIVERPTLLSIGVEWLIDGDDNRTAQVEVEYRKVGEKAWRSALPLLRLQRERIVENSGPPPIDYTAPNAFAGSAMNLTPGTSYEVSLTLEDPDGVRGKAKHIIVVRTREEPKAAPGGAIYHVYPVGWTGTKQQPAFEGLLNAYYTAAVGADYNRVSPPRVKPGDTVMIHAGLYQSTHRFYGVKMNPLGTYFDGTYYLTAKGTPDKPIVIKAAGDGEAVFDGDGAAVLFNVTAADWNMFEGLTIRNAEVAFQAGHKGIAGANGFALVRSKIENVARGVFTDWYNAVDFYIADNVFIGRGDADKLHSWNGPVWEELPGYPPPISGPGGSEFAIKLHGRGHVIAYNSVSRFHDGIDHATYGAPEGSPDNIDEALLAGSVDIYGNDISNVHDNCIEGDGGARNIRIFRNRCFNSAQGGLSIQTGFGGPFYIFQNVLYNQPAGSLKIFPAAGVLLYQNTIIGEATWKLSTSNQHFRNNLILAQGAYDRGDVSKPSPPVFGLQTFTRYSSSDYNGFRPNHGAPVSYEWGAPANVDADYKRPSPVRRFSTLVAYAAATGQDTHSVELDYDVFANAKSPDTEDIQKLYRPADIDLRLRASSKAVDAGQRLANINDGFTGAAPDLGAYELSAPLPSYGRRPSP